MTGTELSRIDAEYLERARVVLPGIAQTYSKAPDQNIPGVYPVFLDRGDGCRVYGLDGREYIDYPGALGPMLLGYNNPAVNAAVHRQVDRGPVFSLVHPLEVEVAELIVSMVPGAEAVRFLKTGSEATTAAVRIARAFTGRDHVAMCGYHGWHDWCIGHTFRNAGVPTEVRALTHEWGYNDLASLERLFADHPGGVAAVVMEPVGIVEPEPGFLEGVRDLTHREAALLIFDEVVTGFRLAPGGAQEHFGVTADLAAFGKAVANGYPLSLVAGRREVMDVIATTAFISSTFGGEAVSLAAARATLDLVRGGEVIPHVWRQGARLQDGFNRLARHHEVPAQMVGLPPRRVLQIEGADAGAAALKGLIWQGCLDGGVLMSNANLVSWAHDDAAVERTLQVFDHALEVAAEAYQAGRVEQALRGPKPGVVFRKP